MTEAVKDVAIVHKRKQVVISLTGQVKRAYQPWKDRMYRVTLPDEHAERDLCKFEVFKPKTGGSHPTWIELSVWGETANQLWAAIAKDRV